LNIIDTRAHVLAALGRRDEAYTMFDQIIRAGGVDWVKNYQKALKTHGHYSSAIDGLYSSGAQRALRACINAGCRLLE